MKAISFTISLYVSDGVSKDEALDEFEMTIGNNLDFNYAIDEATVIERLAS